MSPTCHCARGPSSRRSSRASSCIAVTTAEVSRTEEPVVAGSVAGMSGRNIEMEHRVTPLELFFDLVFVFAFTQVTALLLENESWIGLARGLLVLGVLWWAWASYAWLTNAVDADAGLVIAAVLA